MSDKFNALWYLLPPAAVAAYFASRTSNTGPAPAGDSAAAGWNVIPLSSSADSKRDDEVTVQHSTAGVSLFLFRRVIPLSVQHWLRDSGAMGSLMDYFTYLSGALLFASKYVLRILRSYLFPTEHSLGRFARCFRPLLIREFLRGPPHQSLSYSPSKYHTLDIFNTHRVSSAFVGLLFVFVYWH